MVDKVELKKWWDIFVGDGNFTEIRILGRFSYSGYFRNFENLVSRIEPYTNMDDEQIYFILNSIDKDCYARPQCEKFVKSPKVTTTDSDIIRRKFLLLDFDPIRKSQTNSSDAQFELAHKKAQDVYRFLIREHGFTDSIICISGNGWHVLVPVDLPCNKETDKIIKDFYTYMGSVFTDDKVEFDEKVYTNARLTKLYSTVAKKGANVPSNPWRQSKIVYIPKDLKPTPIEKIKELADLLPKEEPKQAPQSNSSWNRYGEKFNLEKWLNTYGIEYRKKQEGSSTKYEIKTCPWHTTHSVDNPYSSAIYQDTDGKVTYTCAHSHCRDKQWKDFRLYYQPDAYDKPQWQPQQYMPRSYAPQKPKYEIKEEIPELGEKWMPLSSVEKVDLTKLEKVKTGFTELDNRIGGLYMSEVTVLSGSNACVDCDTEYFNGKEWKKISDYTIGDKVLQYNADGIAELVTPQRYIKSPCDELYLLQSITGVDQCVSEDHNLVYMTSKGHLAKKSVKDMLSMHEKSNKGFSGKFYTTFRYEQGCGVDLTDDEIRLMCAIICDGHFPNIFKDKDIVRINLKKERKKKRLEMLLKRCGIPYRKEQYNPHDLQYNTYLFHAPRHEKEFGDYWYGCSANQFAIIADEILYWDGCIKNESRRNSSYSSNSKKNIDFVQFAFATIGVRTHINIDNRVGKPHSGGKYVYKTIGYSLTICKTKNPSLINPVKKKTFGKVKTKDGFKYCFTVPSGMLVLRRNGNINITGNCGKSSWLNSVILNIIQQKYKVALWSGELRADILKSWIQMVAAGKDYLRPSQFEQGQYYVPDSIGSKIDAWLDGMFYLYNNKYGNVASQVLHDIKILTKAGVKVFVIDNMMSMNIDVFDGDKNEKQKQFILALKDFAMEEQVHVILVAHPRKSVAFLRKTDISGSGDIINAVDNCFIFHRVNEDFIHAITDFYDAARASQLRQYGNVLAVEKNRLRGVVDLMVGVQYEIESRRFKNYIDEDIHYDWENIGVQQTFQSTLDRSINTLQNTFGGMEVVDNNLPFGSPQLDNCPF